MIMIAFSLFDNKVGAFTPPFFMSRAGQAVRACMELASDMSTTVGRHPGDFVLYEIGTWDDSTGALVASPPVSHGLVASFLTPAPRLPLEG